MLWFYTAFTIWLQCPSGLTWFSLNTVWCALLDISCIIRDHLKHSYSAIKDYLNHNGQIILSSDIDLGQHCLGWWFVACRHQIITQNQWWLIIEAVLWHRKQFWKFTWMQSVICVRRESLIARLMGPTWGPSGADRTQVGSMNFTIWDAFKTTTTCRKYQRVDFYGFKYTSCRHGRISVERCYANNHSISIKICTPLSCGSILRS